MSNVRRGIGYENLTASRITSEHLPTRRIPSVSSSSFSLLYCREATVIDFRLSLYPSPFLAHATFSHYISFCSSTKFTLPLSFRTFRPSPGVPTTIQILSQINRFNPATPRLLKHPLYIIHTSTRPDHTEITSVCSLYAKFGPATVLNYNHL